VLDISAIARAATSQCARCGIRRSTARPLQEINGARRVFGHCFKGRTIKEAEGHRPACCCSWRFRGELRW